MIVNQCWHLTGMRSELWDCGGVAVARAEGVFRDEIAVPMLEHAQRAYEAWGTLASVADYSRARLELSEAQLVDKIARFKGPGRGAGLSMPAALVVRADDEAMFRTYARLAARVGIVRGVFLCHDAALQWVRMQANLVAADRDCAASRRTPAAAR